MNKLFAVSSAVAVSLVMGSAAFAASTSASDSLVLGHGGKHNRLVEHVNKETNPVAKDITVAEGGRLIVFTAPGMPKIAETITVDKGGLLVVHHATVKDVAENVNVDGGSVKVDDSKSKAEKKSDLTGDKKDVSAPLPQQPVAPVKVN